MEEPKKYMLVSCKTHDAREYYVVSESIQGAVDYVEKHLEEADPGAQSQRKVTSVNVIAESTAESMRISGKMLASSQPVIKNKKPQVKIVIGVNGSPLQKATEGSSGYDIRSAEKVTIPAGCTRAVSTAIYMEIPEGYEAQIRPRSGLALKNEVHVLNTPGTIDSDYRGEVKVILRNSGEKDFDIEIGDRIAQVVFCEVPAVEIVVSDSELSYTERGEGGFGHTGTK